MEQEEKQGAHQPKKSELPFLVTHYLAGIQINNNDDALQERLHAATANLATVFRDMGAFGEHPATLGLSGYTTKATNQSRSYSDAKRSANVPNNHLETLLQSNQQTSSILDMLPPEIMNHTQNAIEKLEQSRKNPESGRTLNEAIPVVEEETTKDSKQLSLSTSYLQKTVFLTDQEGDRKPSSLVLQSSIQGANHAASHAMRSYLEARELYQSQFSTIRSMEHSLETHRQTLARLDRSKTKRLNQQTSTSDAQEATSLINELDRILDQRENCERVIAQLERQLPVLQKQKIESYHRLNELQKAALLQFAKTRKIVTQFRDPLKKHPNSFLQNLCIRNLGLDRCGNRIMARSKEMRRSILSNRLAHTATINTHLNYAVYCLKFDKTGRYFITGADDYLVKVFKLLSFVQPKRMPSEDCARGAVLVCTLKGHAGVINDIEVSSDNAFLATASDDGDCRVWGLRDGCPIAILRGHNGGANMVSWSKSVPYELVTAGGDGLARTWDIRKACLKRYAHWIGSRPDYSLEINGKSVIEQPVSQQQSNVSEGVSVPPLPVRGSNGPEQPAIPLPPLPPAANEANVENQEANEEPGEFVANDNIDVGVEIVSKLQHGASLDERLGGPGTRARRTPVKVICIARCPHGGHFVTGSDDGICRIWREDENLAMQKADARLSHSLINGTSERPIRAASTRDRLLFTLKGHLNAITDLAYSKKGDRILSASQRDGVVRIWSWSNDPTAITDAPADPQNAPSRKISHILIKLTRPGALTAAGHGSTSTASRPQKTEVSCDGAAWITDDTKIVTSQSQLAKQNGTAIVPNSQYLFVWDSDNGHCLLGIPGAHTGPCSVLLPHPKLPMLVCSAGADGHVKLWDFELGKCLFDHNNIAEFGPLDPKEIGKSVAYLDGDFSPDGMTLVLTDESGRVSVFDTWIPSRGTHSSSASFPAWMREQYFSNDYYNLFYDANGYCIEKGSEQPPHLAPRGSRCSHSGSAVSTQVNDAFSGLKGPIPLCEKVCRSTRLQLFERKELARRRRFASRGNLVQQYEPNTTVLLRIGAYMPEPRVSKTSSSRPSTLQAAGRSDTGASANRALSSNYRWRDYSDIVDDNEEPDRDDEEEDEEFELHETRAGVRVSEEVDGSDSDNLEYDMMDDEEFEIPRRAPTRPARRSSAGVDQDDSDFELVEYMSTNNTPSGPFVADYDSHYFRMPSERQAENVNRLWCHRYESNSSYGGRKSYSPQVGDSVVYVPRAHYDTIVQVPIFPPPWQNFPGEASWPVVRCCIRNIRYRFPFKQYKNSFRSIVAILTLELTGVPEATKERQVPWQSPTFEPPSDSFVFEVSVFENDEPDFIVPVELYVERLSQLEAAISQRDSLHSIMVEGYYADEDDEDVEFTSYSGRVERIIRSDAEFIPSLSGSGYKSVEVQWTTSSGSDNFSPWEITVLNPVEELSPASRRRLTEEDKNRVRKALNDVRSIPGVENYFRSPVGDQYSDYLTRIEVQMDLSFVSSRLEADYYSSRYSAVADVRLIATNCIKYNGEDDELSKLAREMLERFEDLLLDDEEKKTFHEYDEPIVAPASTELRYLPATDRDPYGASDSNQMDQSNSIQLRPRRSRRVISTLEDLPPPAQASRPLGPARRSRTIDRRRSVRQAATRRVGVESSVLAGTQNSVRTLEQLSSRGMRTRGRTSNGTQRNVASARPGLRSSGPVDTTQNVAENVRSSQRSNDLSNIPRHEDPEGRSRIPSRRNAMSPEQSEEEDSKPAGSSLGANNRRPLKIRVSRRPLESDERARRLIRRSGGGTKSDDDEEDGNTLNHDQERRPTRSSARTFPQRSPPDLESEPSTSRRTESDEGSASVRRSGRRAVKSDDESFAEPQSDSDDESEEAIPSEDDRSDEMPKRTARRPTRAARGRQESSSDDEPARRVSRRRSLHKHAKEDGESSSNEEPVRRQPKRKTISASYQPIETTRAARSARARETRALKSYHDPSSSEFESDTAVAPTPRPKKSVNKKRRINGSPRATPRKQRKTLVGAVRYTLGIKRWPEIAEGHIAKVTKEVLARLEADNYVSVIAEPMDFRTIEEERMPHYTSIAELQEDLMLVFANCMEYNNDESTYNETAKTMLMLLEDTFHESCDELHVRILRH